MSRSPLTIPVASLALLALSAGAASADCTVNGSSGTISPLLVEGAQIEVTGTCEEDLLVNVDDVRIYGGATIDGQITVDGAQRFAITGVTIINNNIADDGQIGIFVINGASAAIHGVTVDGTEDSGIDVRHGAFAQVRDCQIENNVWGLTVGIGGVIDGSGNTIQDNTDAQLEVYQHGTYRGRNDVISAMDGQLAVSVARLSHADLRSATIVGKSDVSLGSYLRLRDEAGVTGDLHVDLQAALDIVGESEVTGNVIGENQSIVRVIDGATVSGTVRCYRTSICIED